MSVFRRQIAALSCAIMLVLVVPGLTRDSYAQQFYTSDPVWSSSFPHKPTRAVAFGDVDGDGDLDVVFVNDGEPNTLYLNQGGTFSAQPVLWGGNSSTRSIALGDIDDDGDLDLVCGNDGQRNTLYLNQGRGTFPAQPVLWGDSSSTSSIALGDIDNDGDLDLVCGNDGQPNTLYLNQGGGTFSDTPAWWSSDSSSTRGVALGDVDGDGYLDLACGNDGQRNALYLNDRNGASFSSSQWLPADSTGRTFSVALGDVDGDGWFDLVCGNVNASNTLYRNVGGDSVFTNTPIWPSGPQLVTASVALGDVDTDGDLDLVCGNVQQGNTLYVNNGGIFSVSPDWLSGPGNETYGIALGDIDGDGDLDAVCGNKGQINTLYTMSGRVMETTPAWLSESDPRRSTFGVALGDIDNDGDLDAVFGNGGFKTEGNTLYLNRDGVLDSVPYVSWPPDASSTVGVVLGDVDGNGYLDLVCANAGMEGQSNTLYLNGEDGFSTTPDWSSDTQYQTMGVALGDIDGDGDLDLVCGNGGIRGVVNTLFKNVGGDSVFSATPIWESDSNDARSTVGVVLGDVDRDGNLDLVCGNNEQENTLYLNVGGDTIFAKTPTWESGPANNTFGVNLGDVDADGDLDLVCANGGSVDQGNTLYLNEDGVFSTTPDWTSDADGSSTFTVALGDVDGDGDLDLACGNGGTNAQANAIYLNVGGETVFTDAPVWLSRPARSFSVVLGDIDRDGDLDLLSGNETQQNALYLGARNPLFKGEPTAPANHLPNNGAFLQSVQLRRGTDPLTINNITVTFDAIDVEDDEVWILPEYQYEGDPTWYDADADARINSLFHASADGETGSFGWNVLRLGFDSRNVILRLRTISNPQRVALIQRIDSYSKHVGVVTPARAEITTSVDTLEFDTVKAGDSTSKGFVIKNTGSLQLDVTSVTITPPETEIRLEGDTSFSLVRGDSATLQFVHEPLEEFEISSTIHIASNDRLTSMRSIPVKTDVVYISSSPIGTQFDKGREIFVQAVPVGASFIKGALHYRRGGETDYGLDSLTTPDPELPPRAVIPDSIVGERGVEYWVEVTTLTDARVDTLTLTDPPVSPDQSPFSARVTVGALEFPYVLPVRRYRLFSVPLDVGSILGTLDEFAGQDNTVWRMFGHYDRDNDKPNTNDYLEVPDDFSAFEPGRAYWIITSWSDVRLNTDPSEGFTTPTDSPFTKPLEGSWNMVANPFAFSVVWDSVKVNELAMAVAEDSLIGPLQDAVGNTVSVLEPFDGYWVKKLHNDEVVLSIPPKEADTTGPSVSRATEEDRPAAGWQLKIEASCLNTGDYHNYAGVKPGASSLFDGHDRFEVPMRPGRSISLYFAHFDWKVHPGAFSADYRGEHEESGVNEPQRIRSEKASKGHRWCFDVAKSFSDGSAGDEVTLSFSGIDDVPAKARIVLVDRNLERAIDIREEDRYTFFQGKRGFVAKQEDARFVLLVGSDDFVDSPENELPKLPTRTILHQNYPNPFNPSTIIRYELAHPGHVVLRIYDVTGALVKVLEDRSREPGRYEAGWGGENERGGKVSSGVYFYKLVAGDFTQTKKMILLK